MHGKDKIANMDKEANHGGCLCVCVCIKVEKAE